jgi:hypothetical protein
MESNAWCPRLTAAMIFVGSGSVTLSECDINELHIGLKGTMDALYLKDLADKTRRGLRGRVENGSRAAPTPQPASVSTSVRTFS